MTSFPNDSLISINDFRAQVECQLAVWVW